jgi:hypothetical protein
VRPLACSVSTSRHPPAEDRKSLVSTTFLSVLALALACTVTLLTVSPLVWRYALKSAGEPWFIRLAAINFMLSFLINFPMSFAQTTQRPGIFLGASLVKLVLQLSLNITFIVGMRPRRCRAAVEHVHDEPVDRYRHDRLGASPDGPEVQSRHAPGVAPLRHALPGHVGRIVPPHLRRPFLPAGGAWHLRRWPLLPGLSVRLPAGQLGSTPFLSAWNPHRHELAKLPKAERDSHYASGFLYFNVLLITMATALAVFIRPVVRTMTTAAFHSAAGIVPVILLAYTFEAWAEAFKFGIDISERTVLVTKATWTTVVLVMLLYATLIPLFGPWEQRRQRLAVRVFGRHCSIGGLNVNGRSPTRGKSRSSCWALAVA